MGAHQIGGSVSYLSKSAFLAAEESEVFEVRTLEEGRFKGAALKAKPLKAAEEARLVEMAKQHENPVYQAALWLLFALVDSEDTTKRMFESGDLQPLLESIDSKELVNLHNQILAKLTVRDEVKEKAKNSETPSTENTSDSAGDSA